MNPVAVSRGQSPLILGLPHSGTYVPPEIFNALNARGQRLADTDWHVDRLYDGIFPEATTVKANFNRYVIDANRSPDSESLYPGLNTTGLVPTTDFEGLPIWESEPLSDEIDARRTAWHAPYHAALAHEIHRVRELHGIAVLYDCHSIRSSAPYLFQGRLPDFNIGTNSGLSCDVRIADAVEGVCHKAQGLTTVRDGRFRGGWTTRHYGCPDNGIHAIQMELAQSAYLSTESEPFTYDIEKSNTLRSHLRSILDAIIAEITTLESKTL
ncbi:MULTISPECIES: N-formylglutamate deformylase [Henriciella]|uniref:N-formylglutamate deformylase n=1 Tax=Henriciella TaxID=453849 RepID=UPI003516799C